MLDKVEEHAVENSGHSLTGAIPALSVIEVDDKYRKLAGHLLANVYIADSEEALQKQQWIYHY